MSVVNKFPGYKYIRNTEGKPQNFYQGEDVGFGGYVYAEPGIYENVALLDVQSMHPVSIIQLNLFGKYTNNFKDLLDARLAIKRKDYDAASKMLNGKLYPFLVDSEGNYDISAAEDLSYALKIVLNSVYGLTSANFPTPFKDNRNKNNIVALRGALFMVDLKHAVQELGFQVVHIKTDSIKIPGATPEIIDFVIKFGEKYGYHFEHEATYEWFCLVNDAVYIAKKESGEDRDESDPTLWVAVGAQFQHPYVFKTLFTHEETLFDDFCETKQVTQGRMYLDFSGTEDINNMIHVGRTGSFVPVKDGGGDLWRIKDDKLYAVTGTKGYKWIDRDTAIERMKTDDLNIDMRYYEELEKKARAAMAQFSGDHGVTIESALFGEETR